MSRLPSIGGDDNNWGVILNDYLSVSLNSDGTLKTAAVPAASSSTSGIVRLATNAETTTGTDTAKAVTAAGVKAVADTKANLVHTHAESDITNLVSDLAAKAPINSPTFTGTVAGVTKTMVGLGNVDNTSDLAKPISTATQAALDAKSTTTITAGTYNFGGMTEGKTIVAGVDDSVAIRMPFRLPQTANRWRVVFVTYADNFKLTGLYVAKASDGLAPANYDFAAAPTSIGSMATAATAYVSDWQTTSIDGNKNYIISYGFTAAAGAVISRGIMGAWVSTGDTGASSTGAPSGGATNVLGYLEARIEYEAPGRHKTMVTLGHSLNTNCLPAQPNGSINAWPQLYSQLSGAIVSDISQWGSIADNYESSFSLQRSGSIIPDVVSVWAMSNSIYAGDSTSTLVTHLINIITNCRARWPGVQFIIMTEPRRGDIAVGSAKDLVRQSWNSALRDPTSARSLGQLKIIDADYILSTTGSSPTLFADYAAADGNHTSYLGHLAIATGVQTSDPRPTNRPYIDEKLTNVQTSLDGKAATSHTHAGTDITSGVIAATYLPASSTTAVGAVQLATVAQTLIGTDATKAVTPAGVDAALIAGVGPITLTDAAGIDTNAALSNYFRVSITANRNLNAPSNPTDGQRVLWEITASGANRNISPVIGSAGSFKFGSDFTTIPIIVINTTTFLGAIYRSSTARWHIVSVGSGH